MDGPREFWLDSTGSYILVMAFKILTRYQQSLAEREPEAFQVNMKLNGEPGRSTCAVQDTGENGLLRPNPLLSSTKDRAKWVLQSGKILTVSIKRFRQEAGHIRFMLRIAVLPQPENEGFNVLALS
jgi:hypothetical protein